LTRRNTRKTDEAAFRSHFGSSGWWVSASVPLPCVSPLLMSLPFLSPGLDQFSHGMGLLYKRHRRSLPEDVQVACYDLMKELQKFYAPSKAPTAANLRAARPEIGQMATLFVGLASRQCAPASAVSPTPATPPASSLRTQPSTPEAVVRHRHRRVTFSGSVDIGEFNPDAAPDQCCDEVAGPPSKARRRWLRAARTRSRLWAAASASAGRAGAGTEDAKDHAADDHDDKDFSDPGLGPRDADADYLEAAMAKMEERIAASIGRVLESKLEEYRADASDADAESPADDHTADRHSSDDRSDDHSDDLDNDVV